MLAGDEQYPDEITSGPASDDAVAEYEEEDDAEDDDLGK